MPFGLPNYSYFGYPFPHPRPAYGGLGFRAARPGDAAAVRRHFDHLGADDRRMRFCAGLSPGALDTYVARIWERDSFVLAAFDGPLWPGPFHDHGALRALAEFVVDGAEAELGVSVDPDLRRRGVAGHLLRAAAGSLAARGVRRILAYTLTGNRAMISLARSAGAWVDAAGPDVEIAFDVRALRDDPRSPWAPCALF